MKVNVIRRWMRWPLVLLLGGAIGCKTGASRIASDPGLGGASGGLEAYEAAYQKAVGSYEISYAEDDPSRKILGGKDRSQPVGEAIVDLQRGLLSINLYDRYSKPLDVLYFDQINGNVLRVSSFSEFDERQQPIRPYSIGGQPSHHLLADAARATSIYSYYQPFLTEVGKQHPDAQFLVDYVQRRLNSLGVLTQAASLLNSPVQQLSVPNSTDLNKIQYMRTGAIARDATAEAAYQWPFIEIATVLNAGKSPGTMPQIMYYRVGYLPAYDDLYISYSTEPNGVESFAHYGFGEVVGVESEKRRDQLRDQAGSFRQALDQLLVAARSPVYRNQPDASRALEFLNKLDAAVSATVPAEVAKSGSFIGHHAPDLSRDADAGSDQVADGPAADAPDAGAQDGGSTNSSDAAAGDTERAVEGRR